MDDAPPGGRGPDTETVLGRSAGRAPPAPGHSRMRGAKVGRYVLLEAIASGGSGTVFVALDPELDRRVALKLLHSGSVLDAEASQLADELRTEAQTLARIRHPSVATVYDVGRSGDQVFLAMELLEGDTLRRWLAAADRSRREVLEVFLAAGEGLAAAHRAGVVHRDFKPSNVMVTADRRVLVVDFGLATAIGRTAAGGFEGTPAYAAPEQLAGRPTDQRADVFSFCVALWTALCGERPWPAEDGERLRETFSRGEPPASRGAALQSPLRRVLQRGLALDPAGRWPDLEPVLEAMRSLLRRRGRRIAASLGAAAAIALATAAVVLSLPSPELCTGGEAELSAIWTAAQREELLTRAAGEPIASAVLGRAIAGLLDARRGEWLAAFRTACLDTRVREVQSEQMLDAQRVCLDRRRLELAAAVDLLMDPEGPLAAAAPAADKALAVAEGVPSPSRCLDPVRVSSIPAPPATPERQRAVEAIQERLARVHANEAAGRYAVAAELVDGVLRDAAEVGYEPLEAEARLQSAIVHGRLGDWPRMREEILEAAAGALRNDYPELAAASLSYMIVVSVVQARLDEARQWNVLADAALEVLGRPPDVEQLRLQFLGMLAIAERSWPEAIEALDRAREARRAAGMSDGGALTNNRAVVLRHLGRYDEAEQQLLTSLARFEESYGEEHIQTAGPLGNLGALAAARGDHAGAVRYLQAAEDRFLAAGLAAHPSRAHSLTALGESLLALDRPEPALAAAETSIELREAAGVGAHELAESRYLRARALAALGPVHRPEARREAARARELCREAGEACTVGEALERWRPEP